MKKIFLFICLSAIAFFFTNAQKNDAWSIKEGNELKYHVSSSGKEYDFIVNVKKLKSASEYPVVFDWKMTEPVNISGNIKIALNAVLNSNAFYNRFGPGEKLLEDETSVFVSSALSKQIIAGNKGSIIKIKTDGAFAEEEDYTITDNAYPFAFTENGVKKTVVAKFLKNTGNGKSIIVYRGSSGTIILSMSIGFDITLESVK